MHGIYFPDFCKSCQKSLKFGHQHFFLHIAECGIVEDHCLYSLSKFVVIASHLYILSMNPPVDISITRPRTSSKASLRDVIYLLVPEFSGVPDMENVKLHVARI